MSDKKYQTIVIEYEGDEPPMKGFGVPVLGCEVVSIAMGDPLHELDSLVDAAEAKVGEGSDVIAEIMYDIGKTNEDLASIKNRLKTILKFYFCR